LALPTEASARLSLRTQQILAHESGVADTVDPLAGSYYVESLTDRLEQEAWDYLKRIDDMGGAIAAIEEGFQAQEINDAAYQYQREIEAEERIVVGVNRFQTDEPPLEGIMRIDPDQAKLQVERLTKVKAGRDNGVTEASLKRLGEVARGNENTMPALLECVEAYASLGEICDLLRGVFGEQAEMGDL
jgi:methylmalonyl-CoA mutase N-terminal domain/subunit